MNFERLRKIDLHLHLDGAIRTRTLRDLGVPKRKPVTVPRSCRSLHDFLECFDAFLPYLRTPEAIERIAYELSEDCAKDNVIYFEARYAPLLQQSKTCTLEESVQAAQRGLKRGRKDFGVESSLILCFLRDRPRYSLRTVKAAVRYGAAGIDIAGDERRPIAAHAAAFRYARSRLPITIHCGEAGPAKNVWDAVKLGARRIGHGVRAIDDTDLIKHLAKKRIAVESALTSNLQTRSVRTLREHPFPTFYRAGIPVTLNTDDPRVSRTTLSREFEVAERAFGLKPADFRRLLDNAIQTAFCTPAVRRKLRR